VTLASNVVGAEPTSAAHERRRIMGHSSVVGLNGTTAGVDSGA